MPKSPEKPTLTNAVVKIAVVEAMRRSQASGQRQAGAGRRAANHRNSRFRQLMQQPRDFHRASQRVAPLLVSVRGIAMPARRCTLPQIAAGAEASSRAAQHDRADFGIPGRCIQRSTQLDDQGRIERIQ